MNRRVILIRLMQVQALIGIAALLWLFFGGDENTHNAGRNTLSIATRELKDNTLTLIDQPNYTLLVLKPAAEQLQQPSPAAHLIKTTRKEPPARDYRDRAAIKVFVLARYDDHYLIGGKDYWQRDIACSALTFEPAQQHPVATIRCARSEGDIAFDVAGRSLDAGIVDLEMPRYEIQPERIEITLPQ